MEIMIDCPDPVALGRFWADLLRYEVGEGDGDPYVELVAPPGSPTVCLQRVPESKAGKARLHLDLYVPAEEAEREVDRAIGLCATPLAPAVRRSDGGFNFRILADPAGTEFCVCAEPP
jgi:hypothetical protein